MSNKYILQCDRRCLIRAGPFNTLFGSMRFLVRFLLLCSSNFYINFIYHKKYIPFLQVPINMFSKKFIINSSVQLSKAYS